MRTHLEWGPRLISLPWEPHDEQIPVALHLAILLIQIAGPAAVHRLRLSLVPATQPIHRVRSGLDHEASGVVVKR